MTDMPAKYKLVDSLLNSCAEVLAQGRIFEYFQPDIHLIRSLEEGRYDGILITDDVSRDPNWPHRPHQLAERQFLPLTHSERVNQLHGLYFAVKLMEKDATGQSVVWDLKSQPEQRDTVDFYIICFSRLPNMCAIVPKNYLYPEHREATKMEEAVKRYGTTWEHENPRIRLQMECVDSNLAENVPPSLLPFLVPMNILSLVMDDVREAVNNRRPFTNRFTEVKYSHWSLEPKQLVSAMPVTRVSFYQKVDDIRMDLQHPSSPFHMELSVRQLYSHVRRLTNVSCIDVPATLMRLQTLVQEPRGAVLHRVQTRHVDWCPRQHLARYAPRPPPLLCFRCCMGLLLDRWRLQPGATILPHSSRQTPSQLVDYYPRHQGRADAVNQSERIFRRPPRSGLAGESRNNRQEVWEGKIKASTYRSLDRLSERWKSISKSGFRKIVRT